VIYAPQKESCAITVDARRYFTTILISGIFKVDARRYFTTILISGIFKVSSRCDTNVDYSTFVACLLAACDTNVDSSITRQIKCRLLDSWVNRHNERISTFKRYCGHFGSYSREIAHKINRSKHCGQCGHFWKNVQNCPNISALSAMSAISAGVDDADIFGQCGQWADILRCTKAGYY
jgi:hypothetical protein